MQQPMTHFHSQTAIFFFIRCSFFLHTFLLCLLTFSIYLLTLQLCPYKSQHLSSLQHFPIIVLQKCQKQAFYLRHFQWLSALYTTSKHVTYHTLRASVTFWWGRVSYCCPSAFFIYCYPVCRCVFLIYSVIGLFWVLSCICLFNVN